MTHASNFNTGYKVTVTQVTWPGQKRTVPRQRSALLSLRGTNFSSRLEGHKILFIHLYF